jgi:phosphorylcholine metabolism protein LicD
MNDQEKANRHPFIIHFEGKTVKNDQVDKNNRGQNIPPRFLEQGLADW